MRENNYLEHVTHLPGSILLLGSMTLSPLPVAAGELVVRSITIDDPRPLAAAVDVLEQRHGLIITYEDPAFAHSEDMAGVTQESVVGNLDHHRQDQTHRVLIPRGGKLDLTYIASESSVFLSRPLAVIEVLLETHAAQGYPGRFRVEQTGELYHIIPSAVRNELGSWTAHSGILDTRVTLPSKERSSLAMVQAIADAVSGTTGKRLLLGMVPLNLLAQSRGRYGAANETAREVLARVVGDLGYQASWRLFYDPGLQWYLLNIHLVPSRVAQNSTPENQ